MKDMPEEERKALEYLEAQKKFNMIDEIPKAKTKVEKKAVKSSKNAHPDQN